MGRGSGHMGPDPRPIKDRFMEKVSLKTDKHCWEWRAAKKKEGYGFFGVGCRWDKTKRKMLAHRVSYEIFVGPIPSGMFVCHHCDNPSCVNPDHLFVGTCQDNLRDMTEKGRRAKPPRPPNLLGDLHPSAKLSYPKAKQIRREYFAGGVSQKDLGKKFKVSQTTIWKVVRDKRW